MDVEALLDELRTIAQNGLYYADDPFDRERYERLLDLACRFYGESVDLPVTEVCERLAEECGQVTTKVGSQAAVFDGSGRVLVVDRRTDHTWSLPGGWVEPGEAPEEAAVRETREETGLVVEPVEFVDYYTRRAGEYGLHGMVGFCFLCRVDSGAIETSHETEAVQYLPIEDVPTWHYGHRRQALDARERYFDVG